MKRLMLLAVALCMTSTAYAGGDFVNGAKVWGEVCSGCHTPRNPGDLNDNQWVTTISHMRIRAGLTGTEMRDVVAFLQTANGTPKGSSTSSGNAIINLTGYGAINYTQVGDGSGSYSGVIAPILHVQLGDKWFFDAEVEASISQGGEADAMLEYATANYFLNDYVTIVAGQFMSPIGTFKQNLHPTWINRLPTMPIGFMHGGAAPSSDFGLQLRGALPIGKLRSSYALYVSTGPELIAEYHEEHGEFSLDAIVAEANYSDVDKPVFGVRWVMNPSRGFEFGFSFASGVATVTGIENWTPPDEHDEEEEEEHHEDEPVDDHEDEEEAEEGGHHGGSSNATPISGEAARSYRVMGADMSMTFGSLNLRGEYTVSKVGATIHGVSASEGREWSVWYGQAVYNIPRTKLQAVARYTEFDLKSRWTYGLNYLLSDKVLLKGAYERNLGDDRVLVQLAFGF